MLSDDRSGRFNDGKSAASRKVRLWSLADGVEIRGEDGFLIAVWKTADLVDDGELPGGKGLRMRCKAEPDARLTVEAAVFVRPVAKRGTFHWRIPAAMALGVAVLVGLYLALPNLARQIALVVPLETERGWGNQIAAGFERQMRACRTPEGNEALTRLVERLAAGLPPERRAVNLRVLDNAAVNAIALPGAEIIVFRGLLDQAGDPDELAGVLAHELTHVGERHPAANLIRGIGVGVLATMITGDASGMVASGAATVMAAAYTRDDEAAADRGALRLLKQAGIGSAGFATFFRRLEVLEGGKGLLPAWLSTHPETASRAAAIDAAADPRKLPPSLRDAEWRAVKSICGKAV
ncbi:hypothetical protein CU669_10570 [Paramagnetospirillum kuznetsovii]|uniref:Peptidase M48 domain-containing protein n=1 Tax=Paramagnetospirillum kuznetsovii TaxID=2053833 RepID=A0A364NYF8_9PROT|nr:M48 family metallopeptidase [Paramagnetospirillum kuznetsovii]RAU22111.1 hypothetical protein CU669_10570 [Paramagnetospirillum kuznetsovii]